MEIGEAVGILTGELSADPYCGKQKVQESGSVVINGIKGGVGSAETLRSNMLGAHMTEPKKPGMQAKGWNLFDCDSSTFPYQSHHLVPEKQLPDHPVTVWLTDSPNEQHPEYVLEKDTGYDTNGAENGYFMPFASTTHQWNATSSGDKHVKIAFEMMRRTHLQLHQGPHSFTDYLEEVDDVETAGYKSQVEAFLTLIYERGELHVTQCDHCKSQASPKIKVQPLAATVRQVNRASALLKSLLVSQRIFVSRRAADYFDAHRTGNTLMHPTVPFVTPS